MKLWLTLRDAFLGWVGIIRGDAEWHSRFRLTAPGLVTALVLFYVFAFLAVVLASFQLGVPTLQGLLDILFVRSLWLVALLVALVGTRFALGDKGPMLTVLVPGIFALIFYLLLGTLVALVMGFLLPLLWLALVFAFYRLGRAGGGWTVGVSAAFAVLAVLLLVGLPMTLYMLTFQAVPIA